MRTGPRLGFGISLALGLGVGLLGCRETRVEGAERAAGGRTEVVKSNALRRDYAGSAACADCHRDVFESFSRSPMHRMTRDAHGAEIVAPFDGATFELRGDRAVMSRHGGDRFVHLTSRTEGDVWFRVTKVIGGRYREDFAGVQVAADALDGPALDAERILPVSYLLWNRTWRYKGYSVQATERPGLERGVVWRQTCIFCHNTVPLLSSLFDELYGPEPLSYQGSASNELPPVRAFRYEIVDERGLEAELAAELRFLGAEPAALGAGARAALKSAAALTREHFDERHLIELGVGCEMCHGGSIEHVRRPYAVRPTFALQSEIVRVTTPDGSEPTPAQHLNRTCAKCHTVLFSRYPYTWEGRTRRDEPGGSTINSGEARDFLLGGCSAELGCTSCHDPHGRDDRGRLEALGTPSGNAVCTTCHAELRTPEAERAHTHHPPSSAGSACLGCHMPQKNMGLDYRLTRYHRIGSPTDEERVLGDRPLECALCHADRSVDQIVSTMERWWNKRYDRARLRRLYGQNLRINPLEAALLGGKPHERAVAASVVARAGRRDLLPLMVLALEDDYPLVRYFVRDAIERLTQVELDVNLDAPKHEVGAAARAWLAARSDLVRARSPE